MTRWTKPKHSERNKPQRHFVHHKSHMHYSGIKPQPSKWEGEADCLNHDTPAL
jgi:hypothetical protein